ncbi:hypothetical protein MMC30_002363 [Trapelia coarctata]|nr:hypothetical protein [Trapelia coarctata]
MALYNSFPPHRLHSSRPVAPSEALSLLSSYLETAETEPYLQPNALLTEGGPISASSGPNTGLILHNLKRVEAGLRGEHLSADLELDKMDSDGQADQGLNTTEDALTTTAITTANGDGAVNIADMGQEGWQEKAEFEHEQVITVGDVGERAEAIPLIQKEDVKVPKIKETTATGDRKDRKRQKKERRLQERREFEEKKRKAKSSA